MSSAVTDASRSDEGVYYRTVDYAGFWRRLTIDVIDVTVVAVLVILATGLSSLFFPVDNSSEAELSGLMIQALFFSLLIVGFGYFVFLKRTKFRTLGYRFCGARIVNLQGERPSILALTVRFLFGLFGPLNLLVDLCWIPSDECRQALRDKFAQTYVVRLRAEPEGRGRLVHMTYNIMGAVFLFSEVKAFQESGAP